MLINADDSDLKRVEEETKKILDNPELDIEQINKIVGDDLNPEDFVTVPDGNTLAGDVMIELPEEGRVPALPTEEEPQFIVRPGSMDGNTLAGDVMIDFPDGSSIPGIVAPGGLAGNIVFPGMLGNPEKPIEFPDLPGVKLAGSVVLSPHFGSALDIIEELLEKYRNEKTKEIADLDKLLSFIKSTQGQFRWNDEYIADSTVTPIEKMDGAKDVAVSNLTTIRDAAKIFQSELVETEEKGMKM